MAKDNQSAINRAEYHQESVGVSKKDIIRNYKEGLLAGSFIGIGVLGETLGAVGYDRPTVNILGLFTLIIGSGMAYESYKDIKTKIDYVIEDTLETESAESELRLQQT